MVETAAASLTMLPVRARRGTKLVQDVARTNARGYQDVAM